MKVFRSRAAASVAAFAALSMTAAPAFAHGHDHWHRGHRYHGNGVDGGDILAGLLIVGGIAAIASAASRSSEPARHPAYDYPGGPDTGSPGYRGPDHPGAQDEAYGDTPAASGYVGGSAGFDGAVDACTSEIERSSRHIGSVDNVRRMGERYSVEGRLDDGHGYACSIDDTGQIRSVAVDGRAMI